MPAVARIATGRDWSGHPGATQIYEALLPSFARADLVPPANRDRPCREAVALSTVCKTMPTLGPALPYSPRTGTTRDRGLCGALAAAGGFLWAGKVFWYLVLIIWLLADLLDALLWLGITTACMLAWRILKGATRVT